MSDTEKPAIDVFPDRLSVDPSSPYYNEAILARDVGIRFKGVERRPGDQSGNISIYWFDHGWMWLIPLKNDVTSIGCVCHPDYLKAQPGTHEEILMATLAKLSRVSSVSSSRSIRAGRPGPS